MRGSGLPVYTRKRCLWYKLATCRYPCSRVTGCFMEVPRAGSSRILGWVDVIPCGSSLPHPLLGVAWPPLFPPVSVIFYVLLRGLQLLFEVLWSVLPNT